MTISRESFMTTPSKLYKQQLKAKAHKLKPIVLIGSNGLTANVINEINRGLDDHELIKIRINASDREARHAMYAEICRVTEADPIQFIGGIGVLFRKRKQ